MTTDPSEETTLTLNDAPGAFWAAIGPGSRLVNDWGKAMEVVSVHPEEQKIVVRDV